MSENGGVDAPGEHLKFFVLSQDTLRNTKMDQNIDPGWPDRPPLFEGKSEKKDLQDLKEMCQRGIPPALRCAIWATSVVQAAHPHQPRKVADEYGTLTKVRALDFAWGEVLKQTFPDKTDEEDAFMPDFGLKKEYLSTLVDLNHGGKKIPACGVHSLTRVLCALRHMHGIEYAPLIPDLAAVLLNFMPESYAYATLKEMLNDSSRFIAVGKIEHYSVCRAFADVIKLLYPQTASEMEEIGALSPAGLDPIFRRFFTTLLPYEHVLRIMDLFTLEGLKVIFRFGVALIALWKTELKGMRMKDAQSWWLTIKIFTHSPSFKFRDLAKKAYGYHGSRLRKRVQFPRRRIINRIVKYNEDWAATHVSDGRSDTPAKPMGFVSGEVEIQLARPALVRSSLAGWLPLVYQATKLELLYSANEHGRSLSAMYERCARTKHTVTMIEVLQTGATIGCFATHAWRVNPRIYGDGQCFLFRARPDPKCFKWRPANTGSIDDAENEALMEQFQVGRDDFFSIGGNKDGTNGLRINGSLTEGESYSALGFDNEPLAGADLLEFEIGAFEVYRLLREVDGKPVDGEDDLVWNL